MEFDDKTCRICYPEKVYQKRKQFENHMDKYHKKQWKQMRNRRLKVQRLNPSHRHDSDLLKGVQSLQNPDDIALDDFFCDDCPPVEAPPYKKQAQTTNKANELDIDSDQGDNEGEQNQGDDNHDWEDIPEDENSASGTSHKFAGSSKQFPIPVTIYGEDENFRPAACLKNLLSPFRCAYEFKLARWFIESGTAMTAINKFFNWGLARNPWGSFEPSRAPRCFTSAKTLRGMLALMDPKLTKWKKEQIDHKRFGSVEYRFRDLKFLIEHIFKQPALEDYMIYSPVKEYDPADPRYRIVSDLHTTDWWWNAQIDLPPGHFLIPLIAASDGAQLTNYSGDKDIDPVNITVANIDYRVRNCPSRHCWRTLGIFPSRPKRTDKKKSVQLEDRLDSGEITQTVLSRFFWELPKLSKDGIKLTCPDGKIRWGHPVLAAWIADYVEYNKIFTQVYDSCTVCETPLEQLDSDPRVDSPWRDTKWIAMEISKLKEAERILDPKDPKHANASPDEIKEAKETKATVNAECDTKLVQPLKNFLWTLPDTTPQTLWKPDLLHTMDLGMTKYIMEWLLEFLESKRPLADIFDMLWLSVSPHPKLDKPNKQWRQFVQKTGDEFRTASQIVSAVFEATVESADLDAASVSSSDKKEFQDALNAVAAMMDFHLMSQYKSHSYCEEKPLDPDWKQPDNRSSISYMYISLLRFHKYKEVFKQFRASAKVKREVAEVKKKVPKTSEAELAKMSAAERRATKSREALAERIAVLEYKVSNSDFCFPKLHLLKHFCEFIILMGTLVEFSTNTNETLIKIFKYAYRHTNRIHYLDQMMKIICHCECIRLKIANLIHLLEKDKSMSSKTRSDIEGYIHCFGSKEDRDNVAKINRERMSPEHAERMKRKRAREEETLSLTQRFCMRYRDLTGQLPPRFHAPNEQEDDSDSEIEDGGARYEEANPGDNSLYFSKAIRGSKSLVRELRACANDIRSHPIRTIADIEEHQPVKGLTKAVMRQIKAENLNGKLSREAEFAELGVNLFFHLALPKLAFNDADIVETNIIRCTGLVPFRKGVPRNDFIAFKTDSGGLDAQLGDERIGLLRALFSVRLPPKPDSTEPVIARYAAIRPTEVVPRSNPSQWRRSFTKVKWADKDPDKLEIIRIGSITRAVCLVPILPKQSLIPAGGRRSYEGPKNAEEIWATATSFVVNNRIDAETFNTYY